MFLEATPIRVHSVAKDLVNYVLNEMRQEHQKHQMFSYEIIFLCQVGIEVDPFTAFLSWDSADLCELDNL